MRNNFIIKPYYGCDDSTAVTSYKVEDIVNGTIFYVGTYKECNDFIDGELINREDRKISYEEQSAFKLKVINVNGKIHGYYNKYLASVEYKF